MPEVITKEENENIIQKLSNWLKLNSPCHFLYMCVNSELINFRNQLTLMIEQNEDSLQNQVKTEFYKQIMNE